MFVVLVIRGSLLLPGKSRPVDSLAPLRRVISNLDQFPRHQPDQVLLKHSLVANAQPSPSKPSRSTWLIEAPPLIPLSSHVEDVSCLSPAEALAKMYDQGNCFETQNIRRQRQSRTFTPRPRIRLMSGPCLIVGIDNLERWTV